MAAGVPMAINGLITIPGRTSGLPRTTGVAIIQAKGRRWVWAPWGDVQWVRNLRAAGRVTITLRRRKEEVQATRSWTTRDDRVRPRHPGAGGAIHAVRGALHPRR